MNDTMMVFLLTNYPQVAKLLSSENMTQAYDLTAAAVAECGGYFDALPFEVIMHLVAANGALLRFVSDECKTYDLCVLAVKQSCYAIAHVPEIHKTHDIYMYMVRQNGSLLHLVPQKFRSQELCVAAIRASGYIALRYIDDKSQTLEMRREAVMTDGISLVLAINKKYWTRELILLAVKRHPPVFTWIASRYHYRQLRLTAVRGCGDLIAYIPQSKRFPLLYAEAVRNNPKLIHQVPARLRWKVRGIVTKLKKLY